MSAWTVKFLEWETPLQGEYIEKELTLEDIKEIWDEGDITYSLAVEIERLTVSVEEMQPLLGKQKSEIEALQAENALLSNAVEKLGDANLKYVAQLNETLAENAAYKDEFDLATLEIDNHKLTTENAALREALTFYASIGGGAAIKALANNVRGE